MTQLTSHESYINKDDIKIIEHFFDLPLDYEHPDGNKIRVFARNLVPMNKAKTSAEEANLPYFVYLQGGPGMEVPLKGSFGLTAEIHERGYQTLWLDQRGTGLSTPLSPEVLQNLSDAEQAEYLKLFRADNIVRDCEAIRKILLGHKDDPEDQKWTIMGQSFGGFCAITYLSFHSHGLKEVFLTGGLAPLIDKPDVVYHALIPRVAKRNQIYYEKYPEDVSRIRKILAHLDNKQVVLPNGGRLTPSRWQQLGIHFGMHGGIDRVHQLVLRASNDLSTFGQLSYKLLQNVEGAQDFDGNPLYAILQEAIYCQGRASEWAAYRAVKNHPQFLWEHVKTLSASEPIFFTGEMVFPEMFDDYSNLRRWKGVANLLAKDQTWGQLYNLDQLSKNKVKVTSATYYDDMYVDFGLAQDTASKIRNTEQYITNQFFHNGIHTDPKTIMKRLFDLSKRERD